MNYYRRYKEDGTCEVVCTGCFHTLGVANGLAAVREIESQHQCARKAVSATNCEMLPQDDRSRLSLSRLIPFFGRMRHLRRTNLTILLFSIVILSYALPTVIESLAAQHLSPWLAVILPGDLAGCICLAIMFRMRNVGVLLYLLLTICESYLYLSHVVSVNTLVWITDLVPTFTVILVALCWKPHHRFFPRFLNF
jgi:hypothetical protein